MSHPNPIAPGLVARVAAGLRFAFTGQDAGGWFGPGQPLPPVAPMPEQTKGRAFDYPVGFNSNTVPRSGEASSFAQLRGLADSWDLLRLIIETRKDQLCSLDWRIQPVGVGKPDRRCEAIQAFLQRPDGEHSWQQWLRALLEDMLVIDAATIYPRYTQGGQPFSLELVDGATIRRVLDESGRTPIAPQPAYQQIIKGVVAGDFQRDELLYLPRNIRPAKVYGYSPVEQVQMTINIALRRQLSQLAYYTDGNVPSALASVPKEWTAQDISDFQHWWDTLQSGDQGQQRKLKFIPDGVNFRETRLPPLKDDFEEWLSRIACYSFGVSHQAFVADTNRATAQTAADQALAEGMGPAKRWVADMMQRVLQVVFGADDLRFIFVDNTQLDPLTQAQIDDLYIKNGTLKPEEVRARMGLAPLPLAAADAGEPVVKDYNPQQPRDWHGRWTSGGASARSAVGSGNRDLSGDGRDMHYREANRFNTFNVDWQGQPLNGPSHYNALGAMSRNLRSDAPLGEKLGTLWRQLNYTVPDAEQRIAEATAQTPFEVQYNAMTGGPLGAIGTALGQWQDGDRGALYGAQLGAIADNALTSMNFRRGGIKLEHPFRPVEGGQASAEGEWVAPGAVAGSGEHVTSPVGIGHEVSTPRKIQSPIVLDTKTALNTYQSSGEVSRADLSRLALDGRTRTGEPVFRTGEGLAAAEFEHVFGARLERISTEAWPTGQPPDFKVVGGDLDGKTVDFLYTADSPYAVVKMNNNFLVNSKAERLMLANIVKHVDKADYVPMDFRVLSSDSQKKLLGLIQKLTPAQRAQLLIIR